MAAHFNGLLRKFSCAAALIVAGSISLSQLALAQEKLLIEKWLDGEVKANLPKVTYDGPPITLRYSTFIPEFPIHVKAFKRLEADTNGKLIVRAYWGNTLANAQRGAFEAISGESPTSATVTLPTVQAAFISSTDCSCPSCSRRLRKRRWRQLRSIRGS